MSDETPGWLALTMQMGETIEAHRALVQEWNPIAAQLFRQTPWQAIAVLLRLRNKPDFGAYRSRLKQLRDRAFPMVALAQKQGSAVVSSDADPRLKELTRRWVQQIWFEGSAIVSAHLFAEAYLSGASDGPQKLNLVLDFMRKAAAHQPYVVAAIRAAGLQMME